MIELARVAITGADSLDLTFSDGNAARWSARDVLARDTVLTRPLADPEYFARAFIEAGALAWPNGLELAPNAIHRSLPESGALVPAAA